MLLAKTSEKICFATQDVDMAVIEDSHGKTLQARGREQIKRWPVDIHTLFQCESHNNAIITPNLQNID